jgi:uncharacterized protein (TIGR02145 family)
MDMTFIKHTTPLSAILCISMLSSCTNNETLQTYTYCVYFTDTFCAEGPFAACQENGVLSNTCPYASSSLPGDVSSPNSSSSVEYANSCDIEDYKTVKIGEQVWMARNFYCDVPDSKCYSNDSINCKKYGSLYNWERAMTICPRGWHLPSNAEWDVLIKFAGDSSAGTKLRATNGWSSSSGIPPNTDAYGFSALPGGYGTYGGYFYDGNTNGGWWSSSESSKDQAYFRYIYYNYEDTYYYNYDKSLLFSVRCLKD